jgi:hypothetical protein
MNDKIDIAMTILALRLAIRPVIFLRSLGQISLFVIGQKSTDHLSIRKNQVNLFWPFYPRESSAQFEAAKNCFLSIFLTFFRDHNWRRKFNKSFEAILAASFLKFRRN